MASPTLFQYPEFDDEEYGDGEAYAVQAGRHLQEFATSQRLPAGDDQSFLLPTMARSSWFAYEDAIDDWVDITELEPEKQGPCLAKSARG